MPAVGRRCGSHRWFQFRTFQPPNAFFVHMTFRIVLLPALCVFYFLLDSLPLPFTAVNVAVIVDWGASHWPLPLGLALLAVESHTWLWCSPSSEFCSWGACTCLAAEIPCSTGESDSRAAGLNQQSCQDSAQYTGTICLQHRLAKLLHFSSRLYFLFFSEFWWQLGHTQTMQSLFLS